MKRLLVIPALLLLPIVIFSQENTTQNRKENRIARREKIELAVKNIIESKNIEFVVRTARPMEGPSISLTSDYEIKIKGDSVYSALPYFGTAYRADYGGGKGGIYLEDIIYNMQSSFNEKTMYHEFQFQVINTTESYQVSLSISTQGYGILKIISEARQPISYDGILKTLLE